MSVKDEGMGIKAQDKERLFERYYRVQSSHTQTILDLASDFIYAPK